MLLAVLKQAENRIASDALCIPAVVPENFKGCPIKPVQTIAGAKPHKSFPILGYARYRVA
jgi:hypothetical protein